LEYLGGASEMVIRQHIQTIVAISLQNISDAMKSSWTCSAALDASTHQSTSCLDVRIWIFNKQNYHLMALPMFERHTGKYMFDMFVQLFNVLDDKRRDKIIGIMTDGSASMTGRYKGTVTYIQKEAKMGFMRVWCGLHQLDTIVQKTVTKFFDDDFYSTLTSLISYL
jgi:hypothetical protein